MTQKKSANISRQIFGIIEASGFVPMGVKRPSPARGDATKFAINH
ncbi:hypothetical protein [Fervidibacter sp.]